MGNRQLLFESIFKKNISAPDAVEYLKTVAKEHPYFAPAQFYLLQLTPKNDPEYYLRAAKTAILFNNNYWLNYQLIQSAGQHSGNKEPENTPVKFKEEITIQPAAAEELVTDITVIESAVTETVIVEEILSVNPVDINEQAETAAAADAIIEVKTVDIEVPAEAELIAERKDELLQPEEIKAEPVVADSRAEEKTIEVNRDGQLVESNTVASTSQHFAEPQDIPAKEDEQAIEEPVIININISKEQAETREDSFIFEPLHTTDYFASVGIKLSEEAKPTDKLGMQLKSFTDWLKTMKKIAATEPVIDKQQSEQTDNAIQKLAEKSNAEGEVVTEAMADVLVQQGRVRKAIEVLEKLSLLNPSKSVFFAAKINQLKEQ